MRLLKPARAHAFDDQDMVAHWYCDDTAAGSNMFNYAYGQQGGTANFTMAAVPTGNAGLGLAAALGPISTASSNMGSRTINGGSAASTRWYQTALVGSITTVSQWGDKAGAWTFAGWFSLEGLSATCVALFEYARQSSPAVGDFCPVSVLHNADHTLRLGWDISGPSLYFLDTGVSITGAFHLAITRGPSPFTTGWSRITVYKNGSSVYSTDSAVYTLGGGAFTTVSSRFLLGGSLRQTGGAANSPSLTVNAGIVMFDDVLFTAYESGADKVRALYGDALRPWDESRMVEGQYKTVWRVEIENSDDVFIDLSNYYGVNWCKSARVTDANDEQISTAQVTLLRDAGNVGLSFSNLNASTQFNLNAAGTYAPLIEMRRRIRISYATVPVDWTVQGWEWEPIFSGYIDNFDWAEDLTIQCIDDMAPLKDAMQLEPQSFNYGIPGTAIETILAARIQANLPAFATDDVSTPTVVVGYVGLRGSSATIPVYTAASSGWQVRYDDSPSARVNELLRGLADQIGWDCSFNYYESWKQWRLSFYEPPRANALAIGQVSKDPSGLTLVNFLQPHNMQAGQLVSIQGTTNYNATTVAISQRLSDTKVLVNSTPAGSPATESTGTVSFGAVYTLSNDRVFKVNSLKKDITDVRNYALVKFQRTEEPLTVFVTAASHSGAGAVNVYTFDHDIDMLQIGSEFTVAGYTTTASVFNGTWTVGSIPFKKSIASAQTHGGGAISASSGVMSSMYLTFKKVTAVNTASYLKYGLQPVSVAEPTNSNISTATEAQQLANRLVSDLSEPNADLEIETDCFMPWFEVHDLLALAKDTAGRWTSTLQAGVVRVDHNFTADGAQTTLQLRAQGPTLGTKWPQRISIFPGRPANPRDNIGDYTLALLNPSIRPGGRHAKAKWNRSGGRQNMRQDRTEIHVSTSCAGFIPTESTLVQIAKGNTANIEFDGDGLELSPGTIYYIKFRQRDVLGNMSLSSSAATVIPRYNEAPPGALAFYNANGGLATVQFRSTFWGFIPFNDDSTSPAFDTYDNFQPGPVSAMTARFTHLGSATFTFQMPCNGQCNIEARVGVVNTGVEKSVAACDFGIFRLGSTLPGSSSTLPVLMNPGVRESSGVGYTTFSVASTNIACFAHLSGSITANSGDFIGIGLKTDALLFMARCDGPSSVSASWAKFSVVQD